MLFPVGLLGFAVGILVMVIVTHSTTKNYNLETDINSGDGIHADMMMGHGSQDVEGHDHATAEHQGRPLPTVSIEVIPDTKSGYNLRIDTTNFSFTPSTVGVGQAYNQGHAHVYVNGIKAGRVYGQWHYLDDDWFSPGENTVAVSLNSDDHSEWLADGSHIMAEVLVSK